MASFRTSLLFTAMAAVRSLQLPSASSSMCRAQSDTVARLRTPAIIMAGEISAPGGPVPPPRILTEENAIDVLNECMEDLGTLFGSNPESRQVGITGAVSFVELDGPCLVVQLSGRFWHQRTRVVERVESYVLDRIPECVSVEIEDVQQLDDADPDELEKALDKAFNMEPPKFGNN